MSRLVLAAFFIAGAALSLVLVMITSALMRRRSRVNASTHAFPVAVTHTHAAVHPVALATQPFSATASSAATTAVIFTRPPANMLQSMVSTALMLITLALAGLLIYVCMRLQVVSRSASQIMQGALPGVTQTSAYEGLVREECRLLLEHIIADDPVIMDGIKAKLQQVDHDLMAMEAAQRARLIGDSDSGLFDRCVQDRQAFDATIPGLLDLSRRASNANAMTLYYRSTRPAFDHLIDDIDGLRNLDENRGSDDSTAIVSVAADTQFTTVVASLITIIGAVGLAIVLIRIVIPAVALLSYTFTGDRAPDFNEIPPKSA